MDPDSQRRDTRAGVYVGKEVNSGGELKERIPRNDVRNAAVGMRW